MGTTQARKTKFSVPVLDFPRIISPMQERLALAGATGGVTGSAVFLYLGHVPLDGFPAFDLSVVIFTPPTHPVASVPLEPASRVLVSDPAIFLPDRQRLRSVDFKMIQLGMLLVIWRKFSFFVPIHREFFWFVRKIFSPKDP